MAIDIYADGADLNSMIELNKNRLIKGFTTNPTLMKVAGITDYEGFAKEVLAHIKKKPVSFEVFDDRFEWMEIEAEKIASWGKNVYVKIPVMNTLRKPSYTLINYLSSHGIKVNVTAIFTNKQIEEVISALGNNDSIISIFAGRIMDAGVDATKMFKIASWIKHPKQKLLWASSRELYNIKQAEECGADIITVSHDLLKKVSLIGKNLNDFSYETVLMFRNDAVKSGFKIL